MLRILGGSMENVLKTSAIIPFNWIDASLKQNIDWVRACSLIQGTMIVILRNMIVCFLLLRYWIYWQLFRASPAVNYNFRSCVNPLGQLMIFHSRIMLTMIGILCCSFDIGLCWYLFIFVVYFLFLPAPAIFDLDDTICILMDTLFQNQKSTFTVQFRRTFAKKKIIPRMSYAGFSVTGRALTATGLFSSAWLL